MSVTSEVRRLVRTLLRISTLAAVAVTVSALGADGKQVTPEPMVVPSASSGRDRVEAEGLTVEHAINPLGIDVVTPRFAWIVRASERGVRQSAYQIVVSLSGSAVWDSGEVRSSRSFDVVYSGPALRSRTRYSWKVRVWDEDGRDSGWSDDAWFETAFLDAAEFQGTWIGSTDVTGHEPGSERPEPLLRKGFVVRKAIRSARAYICGLGYHELYLNGERIGDHVLDPAFTVFDHTALYVVHDVTDALRRGENAVGVRLGRGFYGIKSYPGQFSPWLLAPWNSEPKLKFELVITFRDGSTQHLISDATWKGADGPTRKDSVLMGETYDARLEQPGWNRAGFDDSGWENAVEVTAPAGALRAQSVEPIQVVGSLPVAAVTQPRQGVRVYDFATTTAGWATLALTGSDGDAVTIKFGEKLLDDGTVDNRNETGILLQTYTYIAKGRGVERFTPRYSYNGYRYMQIDAPATVEILSVEGQIVHTAVPRHGDFTSSSDLLNRMHVAMQDTILNNLHSIPTDTPMYEKRGWTADSHLYADSAIANFGMQHFYEKWMRDHRDSQTANGVINIFIPSAPLIVPGQPDPIPAVPDPVWSASYVLINWNLYWHYGDTAVLRDNDAGMKLWLDYFERAIVPTGYIYTGFSFGDWVAPGFVFAPEGTRLVGTAYIYAAAKKLAEIARALDEMADAQHFDELAASIAKAFNATFLDTTVGAYFDNRSAGYRQTSNLLPLSLGLVPAAHEKAVLANLVRDIAETRASHLNTGALGTKVILPVLTDSDNAELAYRVAVNPTYPGWGYWFETLGVTTMWEQWDANARSHDHAFLGTINDWLFSRIAGIRAMAPAYRKIQFKPYPVGALTHAAAHVESPLGRVSSAWRRDGDTFHLMVEVPVGARADVFVPAIAPNAVSEGGHPAASAPGVHFLGMKDGYAGFRVGSGAYHFRSMTALKEGTHDKAAATNRRARE